MEERRGEKRGGARGETTNDLGSCRLMGQREELRR